GFVTEVRAGIGGPDEDAAPRLLDHVAAVAWPISIDSPADERLNLLDLALVHARQLGHLDAPGHARLHRSVFGSQLGDVVSEPRRRKWRLEGRALKRALPAFEDGHRVSLAARRECACHGR